MHAMMQHRGAAQGLAPRQRASGFRNKHLGPHAPPLRASGATAPSAPATGHPDIAKVLYSREQLHDALARMGSQIGNDYAGKHVLVIGVLKGGFMFTADLVRHISPQPSVMEVDFLKASSYGLGRSETSGTVKIDDGFDIQSCRGKDVLVVEDIVDSGLTLSAVVRLLKTNGGAKSVKVCALLDKRARRKVQFEADYVGFNCPDEFVVGYGIDYSEMWRFLPYVGVPTPEAVTRVGAEMAAAQHLRHAGNGNEAEGFVSDDERPGK